MFEPLLHRILIKPMDFTEFDQTVKEARRLGLVMPETDDMKRAQATVDIGTVVAIGPTAFRDFGTDCPINVGDRVNYARFSGKILEENGEKFVLLNDEDCLCKVKE